MSGTTIKSSVVKQNDAPQTNPAFQAAWHDYLAALQQKGIMTLVIQALNPKNPLKFDCNFEMTGHVLKASLEGRTTAWSLDFLRANGFAEPLNELCTRVAAIFPKAAPKAVLRPAQPAAAPAPSRAPAATAAGSAGSQLAARTPLPPLAAAQPPFNPGEPVEIINSLQNRLSQLTGTISENRAHLPNLLPELEKLAAICEEAMVKLDHLAKTPNITGTKAIEIIDADTQLRRLHQRLLDQLEGLTQIPAIQQDAQKLHDKLTAVAFNRYKNRPSAPKALAPDYLATINQHIQLLEQVLQQFSNKMACPAAVAPKAVPAPEILIEPARPVVVAVIPALPPADLAKLDEMERLLPILHLKRQKLLYQFHALRSMLKNNQIDTATSTVQIKELRAQLAFVNGMENRFLQEVTQITSRAKSKNDETRAQTLQRTLAAQVMRAGFISDAINNGTATISLQQTEVGAKIRDLDTTILGAIQGVRFDGHADMVMLQAILTKRLNELPLTKEKDYRLTTTSGSAGSAGKVRQQQDQDALMHQYTQKLQSQRAKPHSPAAAPQPVVMAQPAAPAAASASATPEIIIIEIPDILTKTSAKLVLFGKTKEKLLLQVHLKPTDKNLQSKLGKFNSNIETRKQQIAAHAATHPEQTKTIQEELTRIQNLTGKTYVQELIRTNVLAQTKLGELEAEINQIQQKLNAENARSEAQQNAELDSQLLADLSGA